MHEPTLEDLCNTLVLRGELDLKGGGTWAPCRDPKADWSDWGRYEAWEHRAMKEIPERNVVAPVPTGDWILWDSRTGQQIGFGDKAAMTARQQAEMLAVLANEGDRTRVVAGADVQVSTVAALVSPVEDKLRAAGIFEDV